MFLKNCWYVGAWDHELIDGKLLSRVLLNEHVLLYRAESGKVVAMNDRCPHRGALLSQGRIEGDAVRCMYHGIKFDCTGKCVQIPGQDMIPPKMRVRTYPVHEIGHLVWIWVGDPAKADISKIVNLPYMTDRNWKGLPGYLHYDASYLLISRISPSCTRIRSAARKSTRTSRNRCPSTRTSAVTRWSAGI